MNILTPNTTDVLKPSQHIPPLLAPYISPIIRLLSLYTHKKPVLSKTHTTQQAARTVQMWAICKSLQTVVNSSSSVFRCHFFTKLVCYPPSQHTHLWTFLLLWVFSVGKWWELPEKHFRFYYCNITIVWSTLGSSKPQIAGVPWVVCFPLTSLYSPHFAGFQSCSGCKVFYYRLLKEDGK